MGFLFFVLIAPQTLLNVEFFKYYTNTLYNVFTVPEVSDFKLPGLVLRGHNTAENMRGRGRQRLV
jgi:hypothetical protein